MRCKHLLLLAPIVGGCAESASPLMEAGPQVELTANPGGVAGHPRFALTLTTWNHLAALADATTSGELAATLDGAPLAIVPGATGYADERDRFTATFGLTADAPAVTLAGGPTTSTISVSDARTTWTVDIADLMSDDLAPTGPVLAAQPTTLTWPSAATTAPWSTIDIACITVAQRAAACDSDQAQDPGIAITENLVHIDLAAQPGDRFAILGRAVEPSAGDRRRPDVLRVDLEPGHRHVRVTPMGPMARATVARASLEDISQMATMIVAVHAPHDATAMHRADRVAALSRR